MLGPNLITAAAIPHFHTVLRDSLPGPIHKELGQTLEAAARPLGGLLSLESQGEISGIFSFWAAETARPQIYEPSDEPFHDGFQAGWLQSAREYCLQGGKPHHLAILRSLQDLDKTINELARQRDRFLPLSEFRRGFEHQRYSEAQNDFLQKRRHDRLKAIERLHTPHLFDLEAPNSPEFPTALMNFIHSLQGWEYGLRLFHSVKEPMEGLASPEIWGKAHVRGQGGLLENQGGTQGLGHLLARQNLPDSRWLPLSENSKRIVNIGQLRTKGLFNVASFTDDDKMKVTRLGSPLIQQALVINGIFHYVHQTIDEGSHLKITITSTTPETSTQQCLFPTFTFRVLKPPQSLQASDFWDVISNFLDMKGALKDTSWGDATYDISTYLELSTLNDPTHDQLWATLNGRAFKVMDREWRISLTGKGQFKNALNQPLFDYAVRQVPQQGEEKVPEFLIRMTPLGLDQLETVEGIVRRLLPELLQAPVPSSNFSFGGQGQVWRVR